MLYLLDHNPHSPSPALSSSKSHISTSVNITQRKQNPIIPNFPFSPKVALAAPNRPPNKIKFQSRKAKKGTAKAKETEIAVRAKAKGEMTATNINQ